MAGTNCDAAFPLYECIHNKCLRLLCLGFVVPFLLIQFGRLVWTVVNATHAILRDHYFRSSIWLIATTPLWLAGAINGQDDRVLWWGSATGIDQI